MNIKNEHIFTMSQSSFQISQTIMRKKLQTGMWAWDLKSVSISTTSLKKANKFQTWKMDFGIRYNACK